MIHPLQCQTVLCEPETLRIPVATLAKQFGVTKRTIQMWLKEYPSEKCPKDRFMVTVSSEPETLHVPVATLAKQFRVTKRTIQMWLEEYPSEKCPKDYFMVTVSSEPETLHVPVATLAKQFGVTKRAIQMWLKRAGVESRRLPEDSQLGELCRSHHLSLNDPQLEQKLFPHLYPHGTGRYNYRCSSGDDNTRVITLGMYVKMRLLHVDHRWRHDKLWMFFAYDWVMKNRIIQYNLKCPKTTVASDGRDDNSYPYYLAKWEVFGCASKVPKSRQSRVLADRSGRSNAPRDKEVIPRWRFLTPLSGEEYYYQLLLSVPF